jgi:hypothetical protein
LSWASSSASGAARLPPFGRTLDGVKAEYIESMLVKAVNRFSKNFKKIKYLYLIYQIKIE